MMPTYDFVCNDCHHYFSQFVAIKDKDKVRCPQCDSAHVSQRFTGFMFTKKGANGEAAAGRGGSSCSASSCAGCSGCS